MRRLLVTGGCGFIGSNLIAHLSSRTNWRFRVFDNESLGKRHDILDLDVEFLAGDVRDPDALNSSLKDIDTVVHLAADTRVLDSINDPQYNFENNVVGTFNLLNCMRASGVKHLVLASTGGAILGAATPPVHEKMVANPTSPYGASKLAAEGYCSAFGGAYGFQTTTLRFSNVYGPRSFHKGSVVAHFFKRIIGGNDLIVYGDGSQIRDYVYVEDLCDGIRRAIESAKSGLYQLGTGRPTPLSELIEKIKQTVGEAYPVEIRYEDFRPGELRRTWCDITKAQRELEYQPRTSLEEGLRKTWSWFQSTYRAEADAPPETAGQGTAE